MYFRRYVIFRTWIYKCKEFKRKTTSTNNILLGKRKENQMREEKMDRKITDIIKLVKPINNENNMYSGKTNEFDVSDIQVTQSFKVILSLKQILTFKTCLFNKHFWLRFNSEYINFDNKTFSFTRMTVRIIIFLQKLYNFASNLIL